MYRCRTVCCLSWCVLHNSVLAFLMKKANSARSNTPKEALGVGEGGGGGGGDDEVVAVEIQPDEVIQTEGSREKEDEFDWWSKFYASLDNSPLSQVEYEQAGYDKLVVCVHVRVCGVVCIRAGDKRITQVCYSTYIHDEQQYMYVVYILSAHIRTNVEKIGIISCLSFPMPSRCTQDLLKTSLTTFRTCCPSIHCTTARDSRARRRTLLGT